MMVAFSKPGAKECLEKVMTLPCTVPAGPEESMDDDENKTIGQVQTTQLFSHKQTSPLVKACQFQAVHAVKMLLDAGGDPIVPVLAWLLSFACNIYHRNCCVGSGRKHTINRCYKVVLLQSSRVATCCNSPGVQAR